MPDPYAQNNPQDYVSYGTSSNNAGYNLATALQLRLDTSPVIKEFDMYLKGVQVQWFQNDNGQLVNKIMWKGKRVVNDEGYQAVMQFINLVVNSQSAQGNFIDEDMYADYICRARKDLAVDLMTNRQRFGLDSKDYHGLMSRIMRIVEIFMTRPLYNKERDSYAASMRIQESLQTAPQKGGFFSNPFGGKK
jgi:hypothetical protein